MNIIAWGPQIITAVILEATYSSGVIVKTKLSLQLQALDPLKNFEKWLTIRNHMNGPLVNLSSISLV